MRTSVEPCPLPCLKFFSYLFIEQMMMGGVVGMGCVGGYGGVGVELCLQYGQSE